MLFEGIFIVLVMAAFVGVAAVGAQIARDIKGRR